MPLKLKGPDSSVVIQWIGRADRPPAQNPQGQNAKYGFDVFKRQPAMACFSQQKQNHKANAEQVQRCDPVEPSAPQFQGVDLSVCLAGFAPKQVAGEHEEKNDAYGSKRLQHIGSHGQPLTGFDPQTNHAGVANRHHQSRKTPQSIQGNLPAPGPCQFPLIKFAVPHDDERGQNDHQHHHQTACEKLENHHWINEN